MIGNEASIDLEPYQHDAPCLYHDYVDSWAQQTVMSNSNLGSAWERAQKAGQGQAHVRRMEPRPARPTVVDDLLAGRVLPMGESQSQDEQDWKDFVPPDNIAINHPWLSRLCPTSLTYFDNGFGFGANVVRTNCKKIYGNPQHPVKFSFSCGPIGFTLVLRKLTDEYIRTHGNDFSIGVVCNQSRQAQVALLADVVQLAFTWEKHNEDIAIKEGWCQRACHVFNDHFILAGPASNPARLTAGLPLAENLRTMISQGADQPYNRLLFHSNGDGSATFFKKHQLWTAAGIDTSNARWEKSHEYSPWTALEQAEASKAYLLADRSIYLMVRYPWIKASEYLTTDVR
jgi:hypothetical protein